MKFFTGFYLTTQENTKLGEDEANNIEAPLAFLAPITTPSETKKSIESAKNWAGGWNYRYSKPGAVEPKLNLFDNTPQSGFRIGDVTSRYSTSNKFFRIIDPRGFQLEISADGMNDILQNGNIVKGEIVGEYVWCKQTRDYLLPVTDDRYKKFINPDSFAKAPLEVGCYVDIPSLGNCIFVGAFYMLKSRLVYKYDMNWNYYQGKERDTWYERQLMKDTTLTYVFFYGQNYQLTAFMRRPKNYTITSRDKAVVGKQPMYKNSEEHCVVFDSIKELEAFDVDTIQWPVDQAYHGERVRKTVLVERF